MKPGGTSEKEEEEPVENFSLEPLLDTIDLLLLNKDYEPLRVKQKLSLDDLSQDSIEDDYEAYLREKYGDEEDKDFNDEEDYGEDEKQGWGQSM